MKWTEHQERHYRLAGVHAVAADGTFSCGGFKNATPYEIPTRVALKRARLIAADQDLLQACKAALECLAPTGQDTKSDRAINQIAAAITKAEGH